MAEMEMRLMVGVTSTWRTFRPLDSSGGLSGSEFFMAFPSCSRHTEEVGGEGPSGRKAALWRSYQERLGVQLQLGPVQDVLQGFSAQLPLPVVSTLKHR